ncbi:hypothetical protein scyTo_0017133 [Scyliorhinus torazame]|uniref:Uncharacterized protein n=1 Tax=Scyliorhinus torazame TaxID=75743 RepID=A0A401Q4J4_SCYTO|nr:hypothetical protein [Scyliorhinus torazame]
MGSSTSHESQGESVTEASTLEQTTTESRTVIAQNGPTIGNHSQNSVQNKCAAGDSVADVKQDTGITTSEKAMEISTNTNAEEKELDKSAKTVSKSRFSLPFSRSVPGRTNGPSTEPISGTATLQTNPESASVNTASVVQVNLQESSLQKGSSAQKQQQLSTGSSDAVEHTVKEAEQPKQKEIGFFDKLFKQGDKGKPHNENQGDLKAAESQDSADADQEATELTHRLDYAEYCLMQSPDIIDAVSPDFVVAVSPDTVDAMRPHTVDAVSPHTVDAVSPHTVDAVSPDTGDAVSPDTGDAVSPDTVDALSPDTGDTVSPDTGDAVSSDTVDAVSPDTVDAMSSDTGDAVNPDT